MGILDERANLRGKVAVVSGGGDGLGRGIATALASAGVAIAMCDIDAAALRVTADSIKEHGGRVMAEVVDVRDRAALERFWASVDSNFERIDILVNVVGGVTYRPFLETNPDEWDDNIRKNFWYVVQSAHHAARRMRAGGRGGSIINLTTIEAHRAAPGFAVYSGMKAAVMNFARTLAVELGPSGIRVNNIAPDTTPTPGLYTSIGPEYDPIPAGVDSKRTAELVEAQAANAIPLGRMGRIADIENCALFLASDLSAYITGQTLHADGGAVVAAGWQNWPGLGYRVRVPLEYVKQFPRTGDK